MPTVEIDSVRITYDVAGEGAGVVLVHGLGTCRHVWAAQAAVLAKHHRVLSLDLPGAGESGDDPEGYSIPRWVSQLDRLATAVFGPGKRFVVAGHSMGTVTGVRWAAGHPERVAGLMLVGMLTGPAPGLVERARKVAAEGMSAVVDAVVSGQITAGGHGSRPELAGLLKAIIAANRPGPYAGHCRTLESFSSAADLPKVACPVLLAVGDQDLVTPLKAHVGFRAAIGSAVEGAPRAELVVIPGAAHTPQVEQPAALTGAMLRFLAGLGSW